MPTFWEDSRYKDQCFAVEKLCTRAVQLIEDTGLTSDDLENEPGQLASMDLDGIDLLADSILAGGGSRGRGWPRLGIMYYFNPTCNYLSPHVSYLDGMKLAGNIYLHNISLPRIMGTEHKDLDVFRKICGYEALKNVILGTTKSDEASLKVGQRREQQLRDIHWKEMVQQGSVIMQVHADSSSAWRVVDRILENDVVDFVRFQEAFQKTISDIMEARRKLKLQYKQELREQRLAKERTANMGDGLEENRRKRNILHSKQAKI